MPDYFIVITLEDLTTQEIQDGLRVTFGSNIVAQVRINESGSLMACQEACRSANRICCVHWTEDDLMSKFSELGVQPTDESLDLVKSSYFLRHIDESMVEAGWEVVEQAIIEEQSGNTQ